MCPLKGKRSFSMAWRKSSSKHHITTWFGFVVFFSGVGFVVFLPFHMVDVACHADPSNGIDFPIVHQAVVSTPWDGHAGHEVPVVQQGHVTPDIGQRDTRLHPAWHPEETESYQRSCHRSSSAHSNQSQSQSKNSSNDIWLIKINHPQYWASVLMMHICVIYSCAPKAEVFLIRWHKEIKMSDYEGHIHKGINPSQCS